MNPETWAVVTTGVVILVAIAASNRSLRRELGDRIDAVESRLSQRIDAVETGLSQRIDAVETGLSKRIEAVENGLSALSSRVDALSESLGEVAQRLARVEGLLEGLRLKRWKRLGKPDGGEQRTGPNQPSS